MKWWISYLELLTSPDNRSRWQELETTIFTSVYGIGEPSVSSSELAQGKPENSSRWLELETTESTDSKWLREYNQGKVTWV